MSKSKREIFHLAAGFFAVARRRVFLPLLSLLAVGFLWSASASCSGHVRTQAAVTYPSMVYVEPGLWVVAESERPIFYYDNYYWLYQQGLWYRSPYYTGGWVHWGAAPLPRTIRRIRRPRVYRHYKARPGQRVRRVPPRDYRRRRDARPSRRRSSPPPRRPRPGRSSPPHRPQRPGKSSPPRRPQRPQRPSS